MWFNLLIFLQLSTKSRFMMFDSAPGDAVTGIGVMFIECPEVQYLGHMLAPKQCSCSLKHLFEHTAYSADIVFRMFLMCVPKIKLAGAVSISKTEVYFESF